MTDTFRQVYTAVSDEKKAQILAIKQKAQELWDMYPKTEDGRGIDRDVSLAMTHLEDSVSRVTRSLTAAE